MILNENKEAKNPNLNFVEKWSNWSQPLRGWIVERFGSAETDNLKVAALEALNFVEEYCPWFDLLKAIEEVGGANFVDFLALFGLSGGEEMEHIIISDDTFYDFVVENSDSLQLVGDLMTLLMSSKEDIINDFVVPHYKIPKSNSLDLSGLFEDAFRKGINRLTFGEIYWTHWVFDPIRQSFSTSDFVGVFEYVLEGQDLQNLHSSTTLTESEIRFLLDLNCRDLDGIHQRCGGWPSDFVGEVLYLQEAYGFCLGDFLKSPRFTEGEERLKHPFEVSDFLESFQPLAPSYYEGEVGHGTPIGDWEALLNFAVKDGEKPENDFQAKGLKDGWSLHCLRQYPSGFTGNKEYDSWFPRAFIISDDEGAKMTFDEVKKFIEGLPTELDRRIATALLESRRSEDFAEGIERSLYERRDGRKFTKGVWSTYAFDGVRALAEHLDIPCLNDTFGEEIYQLFRDYVSEADDDLLSILAEGNDWLGRSEQLLYEKFGGNPSWVAYDDYGFLLTLSERVKVPKKILKCYRKVANSVHNDYLNGNY